MNHAFLIMAHDSPELLVRIINRLEAPNHFFFIYLDKKNQCGNEDMIKYIYHHCPISGGGEKIVIKNGNVYYGGYSMIQAEIRLLKYAFKNKNIDYFHLISGHDYPCKSNIEFDSFFESCDNGRSFMKFDSDEQHILWQQKIFDRVSNWYLHDFDNKFKHRYRIERFLNSHCPRKQNYEFFAGWNWFSWHRNLVQWVLSYLNRHPRFRWRFMFTDCCDEVIFHTLLQSRMEELNIDRFNSLRYIDWFPNRQAETLPLILDERDYEAIISSNAMFCRKVFIGESDKLLDMLDSLAETAK